MTVQLKRNDTKDIISFNVTNIDGSTVNLTGATVKFIMGSSKTLITRADATIVNATAGSVQYVLTDSDTLVAGTYKAEFEVTFSDGKVKTYPSNGYILVNIEANIDNEQSTYVSDQIANRVSDLQILKNSIQAQLDEFAKGASNEETAQARVEADGTTNTTLKARLDKKDADFEGFKNSTTQSLAQKVNHGEVSVSDINKNKGKLDQTYMSDEFLQQIAGNTPINAVPADRSITPRKLAFSPVIGLKSKNLFNKDDNISKDKYLNGVNGSLQDSVGYFVSDFNIIYPNKSYYFRVPTGSYGTFSLYDSSKAFIPYTAGYNKTFTTPANAAYIKVAASLTVLDGVQLEEGTVFSGYESYEPKLRTESIVNLPGESVNDGSIEPKKMAFFAMGKNLFNKDTIVSGGYYNTANGQFVLNSSYFASDFIEIEENNDYIRNKADQVVFYDVNKKYLSGIPRTSGLTGQDPMPFTTPTNAKYLILNSGVGLENDLQLEKGNQATPYEAFSYQFKYLKADSNSKYDKIYTFKDAWIAWENGEKFPVGFFGDSTTDGAGTSSFVLHQTEDDNAGGLGKADHIAPNAYSKKLEDLIRAETGSSIARIYNIGYTGQSAAWAVDNAEQIFASAYSDVKMVGIVMGLNDRSIYQNTKLFENGVKSDYEWLINFFFGKGIQPFFVTPQAVIQAGVQTNYSTLPLVTSENVNSVLRRLMFELANKYNLEIIDMNKFGEHLLTYSQYTSSQIAADVVHFGDVGHKAEAEFIFSHFCPRVITVTENELLGFTSQRIKSKVPADLITRLTPFEDGFKLKANYTKSDSNDLLLQDFYVINLSKGLMDLKSYVSTVGTTYVKLNGTNTVLATAEQLLSSNLDIGLHRIQAYTGVSTKADFKGFKMKQVPVNW